MENLNQKFMKELANIKDPIIFLGLCPILGVKVYTEEKDEQDRPIPKGFEVLFADVMAGFDCAGRKRKKELLSILRKANKEKVNGPRTENTEATV